jgi:hypothetical protein
LEAHSHAHHNEVRAIVVDDINDVRAVVLYETMVRANSEFGEAFKNRADARVKNLLSTANVIEPPVISLGQREQGPNQIEICDAVLTRNADAC